MKENLVIQLLIFLPTLFLIVGGRLFHQWILLTTSIILYLFFVVTSYISCYFLIKKKKPETK